MYSVPDGGLLGSTQGTSKDKVSFTIVRLENTLSQGVGGKVEVGMGSWGMGVEVGVDGGSGRVCLTTWLLGS